MNLNGQRVQLLQAALRPGDNSTALAITVSIARLTPAITAGSCSTLLALDASVHSHNATGHIVVSAVNETGVLDHLEQGFLIGVLPNRFGEVAIAVSVIGDQFSHRR